MNNSSNAPKRIIIVGGGVAGSEAGTIIGQQAQSPVHVIEIECEPQRKFGGWGFQGFPETENTNLALRKMYLGADESEILDWANDPESRKVWPEHLKEINLNKNRIFPRALVREYVRWRRSNVVNPLVTYQAVNGEAMQVSVHKDNTVSVTLADGQIVTGDRLIMASGSISVKVPDYLQHLSHHENVIIDPLVRAGHERRAKISSTEKTLVLGTGLTGEEQVNILLNRGHQDVTLLSREGKRHYSYPQDQQNKALVLDKAPEFLFAETPEEFSGAMDEFYALHLSNGHSHEDIIAAIRPHWEGLRKNLGGCEQAVERIGNFKRKLAVNSIGISFESAANTNAALQDGRMKLLRGYIRDVRDSNGVFEVHSSETKDGPVTSVNTYNIIINAIGRNIIRHSIWEQMLKEGLAKKHASIGVQVSEHGQMMKGDGTLSDLIYVVGMPRAGDHAFRHGYLGNTAFNVPQVRTHCAKTVTALLNRLEPQTPVHAIQPHPSL